ncbi:MAG: helix-turn-helix domain-containing protein [Archaeoglobaceae archaeon]|nr:helix-turn-helix domain-containing protein [Archaeoglobaceae archaeon]MDW8118437.1 helix-turn-helix domain-containing protein [Archaeoglobaceae archaeon]
MDLNSLIASLIFSENFGKRLEEIVKRDLKMSLKDFAKEAKISQSTIYKLLSGDREPNLSTLRKIAETIAKFSRNSEDFIAVIASRSALNQLTSYEVETGDRKIRVKEYPANSFDEAIVSAVKAEKDGAKAIVCAPILSPVLEKILNVPIVTIIPKSDLVESIKIAAKKSFRKP